VDGCPNGSVGDDLPPTICRRRSAADCHEPFVAERRLKHARLSLIVAHPQSVAGRRSLRRPRSFNAHSLI
jgi:hypothetical protein